MSISDSGPGVGLRRVSRSCAAALCGLAKVSGSRDDCEVVDGIGKEKPRVVPRGAARERDDAAECG